jgi:glycosyltransferase involved in cell wall biosynthesis
MAKRDKLRVGMVVHAYYLRDARVIRYAEALAQAGHEVTVICLQDPNEPQVEHVNGVEIQRVRFERRRGGKLWYIMEYVWAFVLFFIRLTQLELKQHFDVIHVHNMPNFLVFTGIVPRLRGAPILLDLHDPMPELFVSKYDLESGLFIKLLEIEERICLTFAQHLITVDQSFKDIFIRRHIRGDKISLVRNMPDERFQRAGQTLHTVERPKDKFVIIYAGTIAERYQLDNVIRAVVIASQEVPHIHLRLVGKLDKEGAYTQQLFSLVKELKAENIIEFHPPVLLDEIPRLLQQAHLGIEPSRHDPYTDYVLPLKLLECVAVGIPNLVSRRPTIENYFGPDDVAYFEPSSVEDMAAKMVELAKNPDRLAAMSRNARRIFDKYNWSTEKATYFEVLRQLTGTPVATVAEATLS